MPFIDDKNLAGDRLNLSIQSTDDIGMELFDDNPKSDLSDDPTWKQVEEIAAKPSQTKKRIFRNWQDVGAYHKSTGRYPVVKKVKAKSGDPKEDTFQLINGFKKLKDAQAFISSPEGFRANDPEVQKRLSYLIWYLPEKCK